MTHTAHTKTRPTSEAHYRTGVLRMVGLTPDSTREVDVWDEQGRKLGRITVDAMSCHTAGLCSPSYWSLQAAATVARRVLGRCDIIVAYAR